MHRSRPGNLAGQRPQVRSHRRSESRMSTNCSPGFQKPAGEVLRSSVFVLPETIGFQECELAVCSHVLEEAGRRSSSVRLVKCFVRSPQFVPMDSSVRNAQIPIREPRRPASASSRLARVGNADERFPRGPRSHLSEVPSGQVSSRGPRSHLSEVPSGRPVGETVSFQKMCVL